MRLRRRKICYATSPNGMWCTRQDRHREHVAHGSDTEYERWHDAQTAPGPSLSKVIWVNPNSVRYTQMENSPGAGLALARILDDPKAVSAWPEAAEKLKAMLERRLSNYEP